MDKIFSFNTKEELLEFVEFVRDDAQRLSCMDIDSPLYFWHYQAEEVNRELRDLKDENLTKEDCENRINRSDSAVYETVKDIQDEREDYKVFKLEEKMKQLAKKRDGLIFEQKVRDGRYFGLGYIYDRTIGRKSFQKRQQALMEIEVNLTECQYKKRGINDYRKSLEILYDYVCFYEGFRKQREEQQNKQQNKDNSIVLEPFSIKKDNTKSLKVSTVDVQKELATERA